jgi:hypothetical protein
MGSELSDRSGGERPAGERSGDALAAPAGAFDGFDHPHAVAAAVADELDGRDDSRPFSADELRTAVLIASHDPMVERAADRVLGMQDGRLERPAAVEG